MTIKGMGSNLFHSNNALDIGVMCYVAFIRWHHSMPTVLSGGLEWVGEYATVLSSILVGVWVASRMWERFRQRGESNKAKLVADDVRIRHLEEIVSEYKLDLVSRRAKVSEEILELKWTTGVLRDRIIALEIATAEGKNQFTRLNTQVRPWLKVFEADGKRSMQRAYGLPADGDEPSTDGE